MEFTQIENTLKENQELLMSLAASQNSLPLQSSIKNFSKVYNNLLCLCKIGDSQPDTPDLLFNNYIPLSLRDQQRVSRMSRLQEAVASEYFHLMVEAAHKKTPAPPKKSRAECRWKPEEHHKFLEALELHGEKNLDAIASYIGTRSKVQVRSHLQKHKLKQAKQAKTDT